MNTLQIYNVLTKYVKYLEGVYPLDLLPSTLIKSSIIVINLNKHYMPVSNWIAVSISDSVKPNLLIRADYNHSNLKSWYTCSTPQFRGHLTATDCTV